MNRLVSVLSAFAVVVFLAGTATSANYVYIESKTVVAGAKNVEIGIYLSNVPALAALHMPFEIREVTSGSYIADTIVFSAAERLLGNLHTPNSVQYFAVQEDTLGYVGCWWTRAYPDFVSPDLVHYFSSRGLINTGLCLPAGSDGLPPNGSPSLVLRFDVTEVPGTFEIDSSCVGNDGLRFVSCFGSTVFTPEFTKGVITIVPCACACHGDPVCDGAHTIEDVMAIAAEAFGAAAPALDEDCGRKSRGDLNCDCQVGIVDVVTMIDVVLRGKDPASVICDGCSGNCP